jgi:hypothetical protein
MGVATSTNGGQLRTPIEVAERTITRPVVAQGTLYSEVDEAVAFGAVSG